MAIASLKRQVLLLLDQVPRPPGTLLPSGAREEELIAFEKSVHLFLPTELKDWLRICNGPCVGPGGIYGVAPAPKWLTIEAHLEAEADWKTRGWIPVAGDGNGNEYVLDSYSGSQDQHPIYFLDHESTLHQPEYIVASSLWQFLRFLLQTELERVQGRPTAWPFHETIVQAADPGLEKYKNRVPFPWEVN